MLMAINPNGERISSQTAALHIGARDEATSRPEGLSGVVSPTLQPNPLQSLGE